MKNILIVDDEAAIRLDISHILREGNYHIFSCKSGDEAIEIINHNQIDIIFLDFYLGSGPNGLSVLKRVKEIDRDIEVVMITGEGDSNLVNECVESGVHNFIKKPYKRDDILISAQILCKLRDKNLEYRVKDIMLDDRSGYCNKIIGKSEKMQNVRESIRRVGKHHDTTILITGESGTGKELAARAIHEEFGSKKRPFITVNCGAITPSLMESEFFGHEKGAFTGANQRKIGCFELAHNGDIFLDEIAEIPLEAQAKLLRVLQEKEFSRVGGVQRIRSNFRLISATNRDLFNLVKDGRFRLDLFYRINVYNINLPPLREKREDISELTDTLLKEISKKLNKKVCGCTNDLLLFFKSQEWRGNVRALKNILEIMVINAKGDILTLSDIPDFYIRDENYFTNSRDIVPIIYSKCIEDGFQNAMAIFEKEVLTHALSSNRTLTSAATKLKLSKSTLSEKAKKLEINFKNGFQSLT